MKIILVLLMILFLAVSPSFAATHAAVRTAHAAFKVSKVSIGALLFAVEDGVVDPLHAAFYAADKATNNPVGKYAAGIHYVFAGGDKVIGYADTGLERAETYFFGTVNP